MKYTFFLIAIFITAGLFLPQDAIAQKRSATKAKKTQSRGKVKKTVISKKARPRPTVVKPKVGLLPALVVPRCNMDDNKDLVVNVQGYPLTIQYMESKAGKLWVKKFDGTLSSEEKDFLNPQDHNLAIQISNLFELTDVEMYPASRSSSSYVTTLVFKKKDKKWSFEDGEKVYMLLKGFLEPQVTTTYVPGECSP